MIPSSSYLVAVRVEESAGKIWDHMRELRREAFDGLEREGLSPQQVDHARANNYAVEKRYLAPLQDMEKDLERLAKAAEQQQLQQYRLARTINLILPEFALQYSIEALLGAEVQRYESFAVQG